MCAKNTQFKKRFDISASIGGVRVLLVDKGSQSVERCPALVAHVIQTGYFWLLFDNLGV